MRGGRQGAVDRVGGDLLGLVPQAVGNWVTKYKKEHGGAKERLAAPEAVEVARLKKQVRELWQENEFLKKVVAWLGKERQ